MEFVSTNFISDFEIFSLIRFVDKSSFNIQELSAFAIAVRMSINS